MQKRKEIMSKKARNESSEKQPSVTVATTIIVALLGLIGTITVAYFQFYIPNKLAIDATKTADTKLLVAALSATPVPSSTEMATATITPTLTNTPPPPPLVEIFPQVDSGEKFVYINNGGSLSDRFVPAESCGHSGSYGLQLSYDMKGNGNGGWGVQWENAPAKYIDASSFSTFAFWVKGTIGGEIFQVSLKDTGGNEVKVESDTLIIVTNEWVLVKVPLGKFKGVNTTSIENVNFGFNKNHGTGSICIDDISFLP